MLVWFDLRYLGQTRGTPLAILRKDVVREAEDILRSHR